MQVYVAPVFICVPNNANKQVNIFAVFESRRDGKFTEKAKRLIFKLSITNSFHLSLLGLSFASNVL